jgi:hypothetical protein
VPQQLAFPIGGLNEDAGYDTQLPLTTSKITNVRPHDPLKGRLRGGRRPGLDKWFASQVNSSNAIQTMLKVVRPKLYDLAAARFFIGTTDATSDHEAYVIDSSGAVLFTQPWTVDVNDFDYDGTDYYLAGEERVIIGYDGGNPNSVFKVDNSGDPLGSGTDPTWAFYAGDGAADTSALCCKYDSVNDYLYVGAVRSSTWEGAGGATRSLFALNASTGAVVWSADLGDDVIDLDYNATLNEVVCLTVTPNSNYTGAGSDKNVFRIDSTDGSILSSYNTDNSSNTTAKIRSRSSDGQVIVAHLDSTTTWEGNDGSAKNVFVLDSSLTLVTTYLKEVGTGLSRVAVDWSGDDGDWAYYFGDIGTPADSTVKLYNTAGIEQWSFTVGSAVGVMGVAGDIVVHAGPNTDWTGASAVTADFWVLDVSDGSVTASADVGSSTSDGTKLSMRLTGSTSDTLATREASLITAAGGTVRRILGGSISTPTSGSGAMTDQPYRINMVQLYEQVFMVDGSNSKIYDLATHAVQDWATQVTGSGSGTLPSAARLIARYRGRLVLSGLVADPSNWFMSEVGDPLNWNYAPTTTTAIQAVAGNASEVGLVGDVVTALMTFSDDSMLIGGDQSIWQMSGDPAAGGSIDLVTDQIGVAWNAWTQGPNGEIYFLGTDGVYVILPQSQPKLLTGNRLDELFDQIDLGRTRAFLAWDYRRKGLMVTLAQSGVPQQTGYFWDSRADSWVTEQYPATMGPSYLYGYDSELPDDKAMLVGCKDGYIRKLNESATDDDGTSMTSIVRYAPIPLTVGKKEGILTDVECTLADGSGDVILKIFTGQTAEECAIATTPRVARTLTAGRNAIARQKVRGRWAQVELSSTDTSIWAVESMFVEMIKGGNTGRHQR